MTFWKTRDFQALQRDWYQRLKDEGFQDAEELVAGELCLKQSAASVYKDADEVQRTTKEAYFRLLSQKVHEFEFRCKADQLILTLYSQGLTAQAIVIQLTDAGVRRCRNSVRYIIRKHEMQWGLREWSDRELNKKPTAQDLKTFRDDCAKAVDIFKKFWEACERNAAWKPKRKRRSREPNPPLFPEEV